MKLGLLISGGLGLKILQNLSNVYEVSFILTDNVSSSIHEFAIKNEIPFFSGNPRNGKVSSFLRINICDVLISVNYLFLIDKEIINSPRILAFNVHGSLLPKYRGRTPHVWAIINNETRTGITAHIIDEGCDTGDIIDQIEIPILSADTGNCILKKFETYYPEIVISILEKIRNDTITTIKQDDSLSTFFVKRTPDDGKIDWDWQCERIFNWVRAQADPYPGAFAYYKEFKLIIDEIEFSDLGFNCMTQNGTILSVNPLVVKTSNGTIKINKHRGVNIVFELNQKLE